MCQDQPASFNVIKLNLDVIYVLIRPLALTNAIDAAYEGHRK